jgi:hypothetical protein
MFILADFDKQEKDYSWIAPTVLGIGTAAAIGVGLAAGHKGLAAKAAKKEAAIVAKKAAKTTKTIQPKQPTTPTYKSQAAALPSGLSKSQRTAKIKERTNKLLDTDDGLDMSQTALRNKKRSVRRERPTDMEAAKIKRRTTVDAIIRGDSGEYSGSYLLVDFISEP